MCVFLFFSEGKGDGGLILLCCEEKQPERSGSCSSKKFLAVGVELVVARKFGGCWDGEGMVRQRKAHSPGSRRNNDRTFTKPSKQLWVADKCRHKMEA